MEGGGDKETLVHTCSDRKPELTPSLHKVGLGVGGQNCLVSFPLPLPRMSHRGLESRRCE